jgi:hypothetical protein
MSLAPDRITLYLASFDRHLRLDPWARRRVLAEIEDHLREAEASGGERGPESFFGDQQGLARDLTLAWLERRYASLKVFLAIAAIVTASAMFAIKSLLGGAPSGGAHAPVDAVIQSFDRGSGLVALLLVGAAFLTIRTRPFELARVNLFTKLAGIAALLLGTSVIGEAATIALRLPSATLPRLLLIAAFLLAETVAVSTALGMWGLTRRIVAGLR